MVRLIKTAACVMAAAWITCGSVQAGTTAYRSQYPLINTTSLNGMSICLSNLPPNNGEIAQIAQAGFKFVRMDLTWQGVEQNQGVYNWQAYDSIMQQLASYGLRAVLVLDYANTLYTNTGAPNTPASVTGFANYAAAAVGHYKHQGVVWEIYNEPNEAAFWPNPDPDAYYALVAATVPAMRAVSSDEWIIGLGTPPPVDGPTTSYIQECLKDGLTNYLDAISLHPYCQGIPEGENAYWTELNQWQNQYAPGATLPIVSTECGWSMEWSGMNTTLQAEYLVRHLMLDLANGIGLSCVFDFQDMGTDPSNDHDWFGLETYDGATIRPSYYFIEQVAASLQGYTYNMRLSLPDPNDYCLLFTNGSNVQLVAWTSDSAHSVTLPSSPCTFSVVGFTTNTTVTSSGSGVTFNLTGEPCVFTAQSADPLLLAVAQWAQLPSKVTIANEQDAINQLTAIVASPAWSSVPSGATLTVSDVPNSAPLFVRQPFSTTLNNLSSLTPGSSGVTALFNSMPMLQDELNVPRTLTFTLQMPDGTSVSQSTQESRKQPMCVDLTTPMGYGLTARIDNPTGLTYSGTVLVTSNGTTYKQYVKFAAGQTTQTLNFSSLNPTVLASQTVSVSLLDNGTNSLTTTVPVVQTQTEWVNRWPDLNSKDGYTISLNGSTTVNGSASLSYAVVPGSQGTTFSGSPMGIIKYSFAAGWKYAQLNPSSAMANTSYSTQILGLGAWVYGDGSQNFLRAEFVDSTNQCFQATLGPITWTGWQWVMIPTTSWTGSWGGAGDGMVHLPMRCIIPMLLDSNDAGSKGTIDIFGITMIRGTN